MQAASPIVGNLNGTTQPHLPPPPLASHFASLLTFRLPNKLVGQEYNYQYFYQDHPTNNPTSRTQQVMSNLSST